MAYKFNPFTDTLDIVGSSGGSYIDGEVEYHSSLPVTVGTPAVNSAFLVRKGEGLYFISRKPAGIWVRELNNGNLADWVYAGTFADLFRDANFRIINDADTSKEVAFNLSGLTTATTRTITVPNTNVTLPNQGTSTGDSPTFAKVTINDTVNEQSTLTLSDENSPNKIEFATQELTLRHTGTNNTPYINVTDGTDYALLGVRQGDMFLQGGNAVVRIEQGGGALADIKVNKLVLEDATTAGDPTATFDADGNLTDNRTYDLPDASGRLQVEGQPIGNTTPAAGTFTTLALPDGSRTALPFFFKDDTNTGFFRRGVDTITFVAGGANRFEISSGQVRLEVNSQLGWAFNDLTGATDLSLFRDAADTLAQRRTTNAQTFRLYNTFTDASNHERGFMRWSSNVLQIGAEAAGTGTARTVEFPSTTNFTGQFRVGVGAGNASIRRGDGTTLLTANYNTSFSFLAPQFTIGADGTGGPVRFFCAGNGIWEQRNDGNAQAFRIYNTFTSATNFERLNVRWASDELIIDAEKGSVGGTLRGIKLGGATSSLLGFYGVTPVDQPATVTDPTGVTTDEDVEARTAINAIIDRLQEVGIIA